MESANNTLGHRANLLAQQRLQWYRGCAIIEIRHLAFESEVVLGSRPLDQGNIKRLLNIFHLEGCANLEPENCVAAIISEQTLQSSLAHTGITREALFNHINPPSLLFAEPIQLLCIYGKHRLKAGEAFGEDRWLVDLYLHEISTDALAQLREESTNAQSFKDGEIYRILRQYQLLHNTAQVQKWWARFKSEERRKDIRRLQRNKLLCEGFDKLLPYIGLWDPLRTSQVERILWLRCHESIYNYLCQIHQTWSLLFSEDTAYLVDSTSVRLVEGLMPSYSLDDRNRLIELMRTERIFPLISGEGERETLQNKLIEISGRILSINTLVQDTLYLERPVKAFRSLLPRKFKGTVRQALLERWKLQDLDRASAVQTSEHSFEAAPMSVNLFSLGMAQLWLFTLRHFVKPHIDAKCNQLATSWSTERRSLSKMAILARRLGFSSTEIDKLRWEDFERADSDRILRAICTEDFYQIDEAKLRMMTNRLTDYRRHLSRVKETQSPQIPDFATDKVEQMSRRRNNCPLWDEHQRDRSHLFIKHIYSADQPCARYPTSFAVTREIFFSFFGKRPLYDIFAKAPAPAPAPEKTIPASDPDEQTTSESEQPHDQITDESPIELLPHPPGTPDRHREELNLSQTASLVHDMEGVEQDVPLAAGFEDIICKAPLETRADICVHRKVAEILQMWYTSCNTSLIVLFLFESRRYYKFLAENGLALRSVLQDLSREHYFLIINDYGVGAPDLNKVCEVALAERLVLVGKKDNPSQGIQDEQGQISVDKLRDYVTKYDVRTGKRRAETMSDRPAKRQVPKS
ncbi:hypothetical protein BDV29DRAFT_198506 [Aspergillus leporis]|uniref:Uncharacterized protein n=1 Tax=Aspergillus leporis TaxID=41062 RepID=A0A5N5WPN6_9EURO|nr:hypothetical protein BDV29DRAFT_198506 [Aspergillus leporis]